MSVIVSSYTMFIVITTSNSSLFSLVFPENFEHIGLEFSSKVFLDKLQTRTIPDREDKAENPLLN